MIRREIVAAANTRPSRTREPDAQRYRLVVETGPRDPEPVSTNAVIVQLTGLEAATDYLVRTVTLDEFLVHVRALVRSGAAEDGVLRFSDLTLEPATRAVARGNRPIDLTPIEFSLLELLLRNPGRVIHRAAISHHVWGYDFGSSSNSLNVYVGYLRRKTELAGEPRLLHTVRGVGYVLRDP
jgi:two-component system response regulator MprA